MTTTQSGLALTVYGIPAPQGSKRAFAVRGKGGVPTGRVAVIESSHDRVRSWRQAVIDACTGYHGAMWPLDGPLILTVTFWLPRPKNHYGSGRNAAVLRPSAPQVPARPPDLSKLVRSTEDALTDAGAWRDDAQIVDCTAAKRWARDSRPPGADITIRPWSTGRRDWHCMGCGADYDGDPEAHACCHEVTEP